MTQKLSFEVPKETNTYADALVAVGVASLVNEIYGDSGDTVIRDVGNSFVVEISASEGIERLERFHRFSAGYPFVKEKKEEEIPIGVEEVFDYPHQRKIEDAWVRYKSEVGSRGEKIARELREVGGEAPQNPSDDLKLHKIMASLRKGWKSDKNFYKHLTDHRERTTKAAITRLKNMAGIEAVIEETVNEDDLPKVTGSQVLMPTGGKGVNRPKPDSTGKAGLPSDFLDWFSEWMKYRGMYKALLPYRKDDDFKLYVIMPGDIPYTSLKEIRDKLFSENIWGGIKLDIHATLCLAEILIKHSREYDPHHGIVEMMGRLPSEIITGLAQAYFKSLGTAPALMNYSFLGLPAWFGIEDYKTAREFIEILEEHKTCTGALNDRISSDIPLLQEYRKFLSSGDYTHFLEFLALYGAYVIQRREQNKWVKQFTTQNLRRLFAVKENYLEIVSNEGFLNIATAIRKATVSAQYRKAQGDRTWDIHYGLAQDWKRVVQQPDKMVAAISDFVQQYNAENARHAEQSMERRRSITTQDLDQVLELIKKHGSYLVGMLLLSYGYAREPQEPEEGGDEK